MNYYYQTEGTLRGNLGDTLQGMAAKAFLPENAIVVDRENLSNIDAKEDGVFIANGWYMHNWNNFPPPQNIYPIYASVHIADSAMLLEKRIREHFKKYAPIGCRDKKTLHLFLGWGVPAYYSSCLTITTKQRTVINKSNTGEYLLVDNSDHPIPANVQDKLEKLTGQKLIKISHNPIGKDLTFDEFAKKSEEIMEQNLERYCKAACVITTKIHCALPCLGMGAKVILIHPNPKEFRLETARNFIEIYSYDDVLKMDKLIFSKINTKKLQKYQKFLSGIVEESVEKGYNIVSQSNKINYKFIRIKSNILAILQKFSIKMLYAFGIRKQQLKRVYGLK